MNRPVRQARVTVSLSPEAAALLERQVAEGKFSNMDEAADAAVYQWQELKVRQAIETLGGDEVLERLMDEAEADNDPAHDVDGMTYLNDMLVDIRSRIAAESK